MKIAESLVQFQSTHAYSEQYLQRESLTVWGPGEERKTQEVAGENIKKHDIEKGLATFNESASNVALSKQARHAGKVKEVEGNTDREHELLFDLNIRILKAMVERFTGKKIDLSPIKDLRPKEGTDVEVPSEEGSVDNENAPQGGLIYEYHESYYEQEATSFSSTGVIVTEDGKEIEFLANLQMSREFFSEESVSIRAGDALKDPLVINFSGAAAELTQDTFSFDIDNDGHANQISFLKPGSGFLALDKNGDGSINNGSELFGTESGNGFQDLAEYDQDGNNWIDENDAIYDKLRIWAKDGEGNDILLGLGEKGIGAIYLDSAATLFSIKDNTNTLQGQVQSTGIFVKENGGVGTVQQIDLVS